MRCATCSNNGNNMAGLVDFRISEKIAFGLRWLRFPGSSPAMPTNGFGGMWQRVAARIKANVLLRDVRIHSH